jgi:hypothetical protein
MNSKGGDVFIRPHGEASHGVIFLDDVPVSKAMTIAKKYSACVVCTSPGNTQIWLATDQKLDKQERKAVQQFFRGIGYTDPGSISGDHLGRICGVQSQKRDCWVNLLQTSLIKKYSPEVLATISCPEGQACALNNGASRSEVDFGWVLGLIRTGKSPIEVTQKLCDHARNRKKRNPQQYAERTVAKALLVK